MIIHLPCVVLYLLAGLFVPCVLHGEALFKMVGRVGKFGL